MASYQYVYVMKGLSKAYPGGKQVLKDVWLSFLPGAKIGVLGYNGAGKSTLMRIMAGMDKDFTGEAWSAEGATVGYLSQEPELDPKLDVAGNVMQGLGPVKQLMDRFNAVSEKLGTVEDPDEMTKLIEEQGALQEKIDAADAWDLDRRIEVAMDALRCPPGEADVTKLSGGERRRVALCRLLLSKPDLLLLDEPTNHLDLEAVSALAEGLSTFPGTVFVVSHDRDLISDVATRILAFTASGLRDFQGTYEEYLQDNPLKELAGKGKR